MKTLLNLATAAVLALAASAQQHGPHCDLEALFPSPSAPLTCSTSASSLADLLDALSDSTGVVYVTHDAKVAAALREPRSLSLTASQIAAADAYTLVESQLVAHEFFLTCNRAVSPTTVGVHHRRLSSPRAPVLLEAARDELAFIRRHPALVFATTVEVEHLELRTISRQLHAQLSEDRLANCGLMTLDFSRTVALSGEGRFVVQACDLLRKLDAEAGASARSSTSAAARSVLELAFPPPSDVLHVPSGASPLADLISSLSQATGVAYAVDPSAKPTFDAAQLSLRRSLTLQPADAYAWIEAQLLEHGLVLSSDAASRSATVQLRRAGSSATDADGLSVGFGDLDFVRSHPALSFAMTLRLEHMDARTLPSTMRALLPADARIGGLSAGADPKSIALRGPGCFVAQTAALLRRFDLEAGRTASGFSPVARAPQATEASKR